MKTYADRLRQTINGCNGNIAVSNRRIEHYQKYIDRTRARGGFGSFIESVLELTQADIDLEVKRVNDLTAMRDAARTKLEAFYASLQEETRDNDSRL